MQKILLLAVLIAVPSFVQAQPPEAGSHSALDLWLQELGNKPPLVSLGHLPDISGAGAGAQEILRERLKLLSKKTFSNRQWRTYWEKQRDSARALQNDANLSGDKKAGLESWAALAEEKMANQDAYLHAIETERDAVDQRLEGSLEYEASTTDVEAKHSTAPSSADLTPFEQRKAHLAELTRRLEMQASRRALAELELKLASRQSESQLQLREALEKDRELAWKEHQIAAKQAQSSDRAWVEIWQSVAEAAAIKAKKLEEEVQLGAQRERTLAVQISLAQSQIDYRTQKMQELQHSLDKASAVTGLLQTSWETIKQRAPRVLAILLVIFLGLRVALLAVKGISRGIVKSVEDDDPATVNAAEQRAATIAAVFKGFAKIAAYAVAVLLALDQVGVNTAPILGSVAILGLAISFGSQNLVRDVVNGFFILIENQYAVGDVVSIGDRSGVVETINIRSTRLRALGGSLHIIPNGEITSVENMTRDWSRALLHVGVAYDSDIDAVERVINEVGTALSADPAFSDTLLEPPSFIGVTALDDSAVVVRVMAKCKPGGQWGIDRELNRRLKVAFDANGIEIPFPQRVVWHRGEHLGEDNAKAPS